MATMKYKPTTPSRRHMVTPSFSEVTKDTPEKSLITVKKKHAGRNSYGKITVRHRGGGNRQKYRIIDFKRNKDGIPATVIGIEYDRNHSHLSGRKTKSCIFSFFRHQLSTVSCRTNHLSALARMKLYVVYLGTNRDILER